MCVAYYSKSPRHQDIGEKNTLFNTLFWSVEPKRQLKSRFIISAFFLNPALTTSPFLANILMKMFLQKSKTWKSYLLLSTFSLLSHQIKHYYQAFTHIHSCWSVDSVSSSVMKGARQLICVCRPQNLVSCLMEASYRTLNYIKVNVCSCLIIHTCQTFHCTPPKQTGRGLRNLPLLTRNDRFQDKRGHVSVFFLPNSHSCK